MGQKLWSSIKKYQFLALFLAGGILFLTLTENWRVYTGPMKEIGRGIWKVFGIDLDLLDIIFPDPPPEEDFWEEQQAVEEVPVEEQQEEVEEIQEESETSAVEWQTVENDYFDDALFIGDSRTVGLRDYGNLGEQVTFYASTGLTIFKLFTAEIVEVEGQRKKITVEEALQQKQFGKIYLMVGINELGTGDVERFERYYREAVAKIQELQPDALIYIQAILKVTQERSEKGDYITNEGIAARNEAISQLADNERIFFIDANELVCDESGGMNPEYTTDGVHLKVRFIPEWREYLKSHAIK